ncbi:DMT family transporter [Chloroflexota bacterium]
MIGAAYALATAFCWAGSNAIIKSITAKIDALSLGALRLCIAFLFLFAFVFLSGRGTALIHTPLTPIAYVIISGIIAQAIGDTIYIRSLSYLNVSRAFPVSQCAYSFFTMLLVVLLLGEAFTWVTGVGAFFALFGIYLITSTRIAPGRGSMPRRISKKGIVLALIAGVVWSLAALALKLGVVEMDPLVAAAIRVSSAAIALTSFALSRRKRGALELRRYGFRSLALALTSGLIDYGLGMVFFIIAIQLIGAGKTVVLSATSPLFLLPFSVFILKERLTRFTLLGILIGIAGIYLVSL